MRRNHEYDIFFVHCPERRYMLLQEELKTRSKGAVIQGLTGFFEEHLDPKWQEGATNLSGMIYIAALFEPDALGLNSPMIPVHAIVDQEYAKGGPTLVLIEKNIKWLRSLNPEVVIEYAPYDVVRSNFALPKK